jgi:hypothetical protein
LHLQTDVARLSAALAQVEDRLNHHNRTSKWPDAADAAAAEDLDLARRIEGHAQPSIPSRPHDIHPEKLPDGVIRNNFDSVDPSVRFPQMYYARHFLFSFLNEVRVQGLFDTHALTFAD